jgi:hypothetical protein
LQFAAARGRTEDVDRQLRTPGLNSASHQFLPGTLGIAEPTIDESRRVKLQQMARLLRTT